MYFSTKNIPELDGLSVRQRQEVIHLAVANLPASKKITLNVVKIACLTPIFLLLANIESWWLLLYLLIVGLCYPLITTPLTLMFIKPLLKEARAEFENNNK
ncbi:MULTISPECIES: DUF6170 family protein [Pseudoalteromonas]|uniref:DUF6170 family protein n=1 Tax=Pseudoalteromonas TaxID=53246 RepID=UPI00026C9564|nr:MULTISPECIES: DUF6170 family protein [Pseudoalteromonas]ATC98110.1 hypothetical protein PSPO_a0960 [Pseudoalteromonas spongiae UST010723-006]TMO83734.1 hypothetical protein CWC15_13625 [Pseudoalteromonas spongiae]